MKGKYQVLLTAIAVGISALASILSFIWILVSLIYDLAKDTGFDWNSVITFIISVLTMFCSFFVLMVLSDKENRRKAKEIASKEVPKHKGESNHVRNIKDSFKKGGKKDD